jgi:hypothetical protein
MADSPYAPISLGRWDPYRRTPSILPTNGKIKFLPGPGTEGEFGVKEVSFPMGAILEYRVQKGDMYFAGDHGQSLGRTLWAIEPDGGRHLLAEGFVLYISLTVAARNLKKHGIAFRAIGFYEGSDGQVVENEISIPDSGSWSAIGLFLGLSNFWLGALAGIFVHNVLQIIAIGASAFAIIAIVRLRVAASKRVAFAKIATMLFTYPIGYAVSVILARWVLGDLIGR